MAKLEYFDVYVNSDEIKGRYIGWVYRKDPPVSPKVFPPPLPSYSFHGEGIMRYENGDIYEGQWLDNKRSGNGRLTTKNDEYVGAWSDGKATGYGKKVWKDGTAYEGWFVDGQREGFGTVTWAQYQGRSFTGHWSGDDIKGYGIFHFHNGKWRKGHYEKDSAPPDPDFPYKEKGKGRFVGELEMGLEYDGQVQDGQMHGRGKLTNWMKDEETVYIGEFKNDKKSGSGIEISPHQISEGTWSNGVKKGKFKDIKLGTLTYSTW